MTPKAQAIEAEINTWGSIKLNNFCAAKAMIHRVKRQAMEPGKFFQITDPVIMVVVVAVVVVVCVCVFCHSDWVISLVLFPVY